MHVEIDDTPFETLEDVPELIRLYAEISSDSEGDVLKQSNSILKDAVQYDGRNNRPVGIKRAFYRAAKQRHETSKNRVNDSLVSDTKSFFAVAVAGGFMTTESLRQYMGDDANLIVPLASVAKNQRLTNDQKRAFGRAMREQKKNESKGSVTSPLPHPRAVGRQPQ
jgi:hypothetical protein